MSTDRTLMLEQNLLGALMLHPEAYDRVADLLTEEAFAHAVHRQIWRHVEATAIACMPCDVLVVYDRSRTKDPQPLDLNYLHSIAQASYGLGSLRTLAEKVRGLQVTRQLRDAGMVIAQLAEDESQAIEAKVDQAQQALATIGKAVVRKAPKRIDELIVSRIDRWNDLERGDIEPAWPTGIPGLDNAMNGGLRPGQLIILAARPAVGKSSFAQQLGIGQAQAGRPTLFLSQEMPDGELVDRAAANLGRIDYGSIQSGKFEKDEWTRAVEAVEAVRDLPYYIDDQPALTLAQLRAKARMVPGLRVLLLDYLQLCAGSSGDNRNSEIEAISRGLKALAKEMGAAVIALSQLNRKVEERASKRPMLSDLRDSGAIEQDADVVMFLWPVRDLGEQQIRGLGIDKNRAGRCCEIPLAFIGKHQRWVESTADISPPSDKPATYQKGFTRP